MNELVEWLRAQLDEDERTARAATQGEWVWSREFVTPPGYHHRTVGPLEPGDAAFIAEHDPARVLREIDAKRRTIALCEPPLVDVTGPQDAERQFVPGEGPPWGLDVLKLLALPYADRPGYEESWRP